MTFLYCKKLFSFLAILVLIFLGSCTNPRMDPIRKQRTSAGPGDPWDPDYSEWYCPKPIPPPSPIQIIPDSSDEYDLSSLLDIALNNHPLTKLAWTQARAEAFAVGIAESAYYPTLTGNQSLTFNDFTVGSLSGSGSVGTTPGSGTVTTPGGTTIPRTSTAATGTATNGSVFTETVVTQLSLSYLILDFGGREANVRSIKYALQALNWTQNRVIQQVLFGVIQGYYIYINSKELLIAKEEDLKNSKENLASAESLFNAGVVRRLDLLQAQANLENATLAVITAKNQIKINLGALAVALGVEPSTEFEAKNLPAHFPVDDISLTIESLMELAKENRPDLASAYATVLQNTMNYKAAISSSLPTLTANGNTQWISYLHPRGTPDGHFYTGAISINVPIFSGFLYENQIRQARENIRAAKANFDNIENTALLDVVMAYYNFSSAKEAIKYSESYLKFAQEAYDVALGTYKTGTGSMLDLLSSLAVLSNARAQYIDSRTKWAISLFNIAFATGTLNESDVIQEIK